MRVFLILIFSNLFQLISTQEDFCESWVCIKSKNICYGKTCGFEKYVMNPDSFTFFMKIPVKDLDFKTNTFRTEIDYFKKYGKGNYEYFIQQMNQIAHSRERLNLLKETDYYTLDDILKIAYVNFKSDNVQQEYINLYNKRKTILNLDFDSRSMYYNLLEDKIISDIENLNQFLSENHDDDVRGIMLYPLECDSTCIFNYSVLMSIWYLAMKQLYKVFLNEMINFDCDYQEFNLKRAFLQFIIKYPNEIQNELLNYYDYIMNPGICFTH